MDGHFRLDLKPLAQHREGLDELIAERPVAGHDIADAALEDGIHQPLYQPVAHIMEGTLILRVVSGGQTVAHHHIHLAFQHQIHHFPGVFRRVGVVAVDHQVAVRVDLPEHGADHIALSLTVLVAHNGPRLPSDVVGMVGGVIIIDVNIRFRQGGAVIPDHLGDGFRFIIAGDQHGNGHSVPSFPLQKIRVFSLGLLYHCRCRVSNRRQRT